MTPIPEQMQENMAFAKNMMDRMTGKDPSIGDVSRWQFHRRDLEPHMLTFDAGHNVAHVAKALGPLAGAAEHRDHAQPEGAREEKRAADLIIHAIWLVQALGYNPSMIVRERIEGFKDGFL